MVNLITTYFRINHHLDNKDWIKYRQSEYTFCLKKNLGNQYVKNIHLLYEKKDDIDAIRDNGIDVNNPKFIFYKIGRYLHYNDVFRYANKYLKDEICIYLHADNYLKSGFENITKKHLKNRIFALPPHKPDCNRNFICGCSRYFQTNKGFFGPSFDGWVFLPPIDKIIVDNLNHAPNRLGGENRLIAWFKNNNYKVESPQCLLNNVHMHRIRNNFNTTRSFWIEYDGSLKPINYYSKIHAEQKNKPYEDKIVGGGLPFFSGVAKYVDRLNT